MCWWCLPHSCKASSSLWCNINTSSRLPAKFLQFWMMILCRQILSVKNIFSTCSSMFTVTLMCHDTWLVEADAPVLEDTCCSLVSALLSPDQHKSYERHNLYLRPAIHIWASSSNIIRNMLCSDRSVRNCRKHFDDHINTEVIKTENTFDYYFFICKIRQLVDEHQDLPDQHGCLRHHHVHHRGPRHSLHCIQGILVIRSNILLHPASPPGPHSEYSNKF